MAGLADAGLALLVRPHPGRAVDGHRHVAPRAQPDADGADATGRGGREAPRAVPGAAAAGERPDEDERPRRRPGAGVFFVSLAIFVQGLLPSPRSRAPPRSPRSCAPTWASSSGCAPTPPIELEQLGRQVYIREELLVLPFAVRPPGHGRDAALGPVSQAGEYAFDVPHLFSTRRIGPDLTRVGLKFSDEWHLAHFWDPRMLVPDSIMPRFVGLFDVPSQRVAIVDDDAGNRTLERNEVTEAIFDFDKKGTARSTGG